MHLIEQKQVEDRFRIIANAVRTHMSHRNTQHMPGAVQGVETKPFQASV